MIGGQLLDVFSEQEMDEFVTTLKTVPSRRVMQNDCHGVDEHNVYMMWFQKKIFCRIQKIFGQDLRLVFGMFLDENQPWGVHTDAIHVNGQPERQAALSMVIPYSVDHRKDLVTKSCTIVFNEGGQDNQDIFAFADRHDRPNSAMTIFQQHLSHNPEQEVKKLTIQGVYPWKLGSIIYWNSLYFHDSDNFHANGYASKPALVMHTYTPRTWT